MRFRPAAASQATQLEFMSQPLFATLEELKQFVAHAEPDQFEKALKQFSITELANIFSMLPTSDPRSDQLGIALFDHIVSTNQLETIGEHLSMQDFLHILDFLTMHPNHQNKLSVILIGLPPKVFCASFNFYQAGHLALFKAEGMHEPLQYHLTQFVHEGETLGRYVAEQLEQFKANLVAMNPQELTRQSLDNLISQIDSIRNQLLDFLEKISVSLSIAWNTDRIDLIEKLSTLNEALQHQLVLFVGHPSSDTLPPKGLYLEIEKVFSKVFDSSLHDGDAAIEGLTRLAVWQLKDYWELGLLPQIEHQAELDVDSANLKDIQDAARREQLFAQVQKQLEHLKIGTVRELKRQHLYSKALLKAYVNEHHYLLQN